MTPPGISGNNAFGCLGGVRETIKYPDACLAGIMLWRARSPRHPLAPVVVNPASESGKLAAFERRRRMGFGDFLGPAEIDAMHVHNVTDYLGVMTGVIVSANGGIWTNRCGGSVTLFLDGAPLELLPGQVIDDVLSATEIVAIEVYRGPAQIPIEYNLVAECAVILFWTRTGP